MSWNGKFETFGKAIGEADRKENLKEKIEVLRELEKQMRKLDFFSKNICDLFLEGVDKLEEGTYDLDDFDEFVLSDIYGWADSNKVWLGLPAAA